MTMWNVRHVSACDMTMWNVRHVSAYDMTMWNVRQVLICMWSIKRWKCENNRQVLVYSMNSKHSTCDNGGSSRYRPNIEVFRTEGHVKMRDRYKFICTITVCIVKWVSYLWDDIFIFFGYYDNIVLFGLVDFSTAFDGVDHHIVKCCHIFNIVKNFF